ncbi:MAG: Hsp20/alpha crystallin family protein [Gammaproteobacteria bacterium]
MDKATEAKQGKQVQKAAPSSEVSTYDDMERMFDTFFRRGWMRPWRWDWPAFGEVSRALETRLPHVDVIDRDGEVIVKAELPGVEKKDLDVSMTEDSVTIKGSTRREEKEEKGDYYRCEISRGEFSRTVALPAAVDTAKAKASFKDGMLELVIPKTEARKRRAISVE